jgi:hypothetical protein
MRSLARSGLAGLVDIRRLRLDEDRVLISAEN